MRRSRQPILLLVAALYCMLCAWGALKHWEALVAETRAELIGVEK